MQLVENEVSVDKSYLLTIIDSINDLFYTTDEFGCFHTIYGTLLRKIGPGRENFIGRLIFVIFGKDPEGIHAVNHKKCLNGASQIYVWNFEYNGKIYYFQTSLSPIRSNPENFRGIVGIIRDITRHKEIELINEEITLKFRTLANAANLAIISINEEQKIEYCNSATLSMFGYENEMIHGREFSLLFSEKNKILNLNNIPAQFGSDDKYTFELEAKKRDGAVFPIEITISPYQVLNIIHHVIIIQDISERKNAEIERIQYSKKLEDQNKELEIALESLKSMQLQLIHSEKLASIGQLTSGIAHEINNPLAFVSSNLNRFYEYFTDLLTVTERWRTIGKNLLERNIAAEMVNDLFEFEKQIDLDFIKNDFNILMQHNKSGIERIQNIVMQLRGFSRDDFDLYLETDLNAALDDTLTIAWNEIKYKAEVIKQYENIPAVRCNPNEIRQVILNLMINAAHSITDSGKIFLRTYQDKKFVYAEVTDTGVGIKKDELKKIFDPFFTTKPPGKGTGLGLWISLTLAQKNRAMIDVKSTPGKGSSFIIKFKKHEK